MFLSLSYTIIKYNHLPKLNQTSRHHFVVLYMLKYINDDGSSICSSYDGLISQGALVLVHVSQSSDGLEKTNFSEYKKLLGHLTYCTFVKCMILLTYNNEEERFLDCFEKKLFGLCLDCLLFFIKLLLTSCTSSELVHQVRYFIVKQGMMEMM